MNAKYALASFSVALLASGCATFEPVPKDYAGPTATLQDTGFSESASKAQLFAAVEVDGHQIMNAFWASANASHGRGNSLTTDLPMRKVKAMPMRVHIQCGHAAGAPIAEIASQIAGTFFWVDGVVDFAPRPNGRYAVKGELKKEASTCWIEDLDAGKPATTVVTK